VLRCAEALARGVRLVPVNAGGRLDLEAFAENLAGAALVSEMTLGENAGSLTTHGQRRS